MSESLYKISDDLLTIFAEIEANDGEVTEEQLKNLQISEDKLIEKLNNYYKAITIWENNAAECKNEKKRINTTQKKFEKRVESLKSRMLEAVELFGQEGKKNKYIELSTVRLSTKHNKKIITNDIRIDNFIQLFRSYVEELVANGVLYVGADVDMEGILASINTIAKSYDENYVPFTLEDLYSLNIELSINGTIADLFTNHEHALIDMAKDSVHSTMKNITSAEQWKSSLAKTNSAEIEDTTLAYEEHYNSLLIR